MEGWKERLLGGPSVIHGGTKVDLQLFLWKSNTVINK